MFDKDDTDLWQSYLKGDKDSFSMIYNRYFKTLYEYGMRKINHEDAVRDCIHDLFVKLWINRQSLSDTSNVKYYLIASMRNQLINYSVKANRMQQVNLSEAENFVMDFNAEADYIKRENLSEQSKKIIAALNQLTPRQREVLYLRFFEELSYEEIANLMDISVKGIYKLHYRALDAIKLVLSLPKGDVIALLVLFRLEMLS